MNLLKFTFDTPIFTMTTFKFIQNRVCVAPSSNCMSQHIMVNTLQCQLSYIWQAIVVQPFTHLTRSNIIQEFSMFSPTCIFFTSFIPLPRRSTEILKTNTLSFDYPGNRLAWTNLKAKWSLNVIILSIVSIPLHKALIYIEIDDNLGTQEF